MAKIIGITGGIGSGKTTLINFIKELGFNVYISDKESKKILNDEEIVKKIQFLFPEYVLINENVLDKQKLSEIVFNNSEQLQKLNNLIHPLVKESFNDWVTEHQSDSLLFKESAILFESGADKECDYKILITAPIDVRIERVMKRDGISKNKVIERMNNQWPDERKAEHADFIIENIDLTLAKQQIINIINKII